MVENEPDSPASDAASKKKDIGLSYSDWIALARDKSAAARSRLVGELGRVATLDLDPETDGATCEVVNEIFKHLISQIEVDLRKQVAIELNKSDWVAKDIVLSLAADVIEVAFPVLTRNKRLTDPDLVSIAQRKSTEHRIAIAGRPNIGAPVGDALGEFNEQAVMVVLMSNATAALSEKLVNFLSEEAKERASYRDAMLTRRDLPDHIYARVVRYTAEAVREDIAERFGLDAGKLREIVAAAVKELIAAPKESDNTSMIQATLALADQLEDEQPGNRTPFWLGHLGLFEARLVSRLNIPVEAVRQLIFDFAPFGIALLAQATGMTVADLKNACSNIYGDKWIAGKQHSFDFTSYENAHRAITPAAARNFVERLQNEPHILRFLDTADLVRLR